MTLALPVLTLKLGPNIQASKSKIRELRGECILISCISNYALNDWEQTLWDLLNWIAHTVMHREEKARLSNNNTQKAARMEIWLNPSIADGHDTVRFYFWVVCDWLIEQQPSKVMDIWAVL